MIPKTLWTYWYGETGPSWLRLQTFATFRRHHPDWAATLLHERPDGCVAINPQGERNPLRSCDNGREFQSPAEREDLASFWPLNAPAALPPDARCDLVRWCLLASLGGAFADLDVLFLRPLPEEWLASDALTVTLDGGTPEEISPVRIARQFAIGLVLAPQGCPLAASIARRAIARALAWKPGDDHQALGTGLLARELRDAEREANRKADGIPASALYPQGFLRAENDLVWREERAPRWDLGALAGLHWGGGHARSRELEHDATEAWARSSLSFVARAWRRGMGVDA